MVDRLESWSTGRVVGLVGLVLHMSIAECRRPDPVSRGTIKCRSVPLGSIGSPSVSR